MLVWGVRERASVESTRRIATDFMASPLFLGVERRDFWDGGAVRAGDLKGGSRVLWDLETSMGSGPLGRFVAGSDTRDSKESLERFLEIGALVGLEVILERGTSSSSSVSGALDVDLMRSFSSSRNFLSG